MRTHAAILGGSEVTVYEPERRDDLGGFHAFLGRSRRLLAMDTETTGLAVYSPGFQVRLVQFGDTQEAWVLRADQFRGDITTALARPVPLVLHHAAFDALALDRAGLARLEDLYPRTVDTRILAHLLDPRAQEEGGIGHSLKPLSAHYVDPAAPDTQKGLHVVFRELGLKQADGWAGIPVDHPTYVLYAGLDVILTARLAEVLGPLAKAAGYGRLSAFEHQLASLCARMERRGMLLDAPYTEGLKDVLAEQREEGLAEARLYGVENVESPRQVAAALQGMGVELSETTPSGQPKVDKAVLATLADQGNPLAAAVIKAKRAAKFRTAYVDGFLAAQDAQGRIHPHINPLQARTARMSVSSPPLQQLPSGDHLIRRCLVADPGNVIISADYAQVELRVLAALADERRMKDAIAAGEDLHDVTAAALFGPAFTKAQRKLAKGVGFGRVYGGGAAHLARQSGVPLEDAKRAVDLYDRRFPGVKRLSRRIIDRANAGVREVVTPSGRRLPLDRDRAYSGVNYLVQSTSRDVLAQALLDLDEAGLGECLLLPIHDEVLAQGPAESAEEVAREIAKVMTQELAGVRLDAEAEVGRRSWGSLYGSPE